MNSIFDRRLLNFVSPFLKICACSMKRTAAVLSLALRIAAFPLPGDGLSDLGNQNTNGAIAVRGGEEAQLKERATHMNALDTRQSDFGSILGGQWPKFPGQPNSGGSHPASSSGGWGHKAARGNQGGRESQGGRGQQGQRAPLNGSSGSPADLPPATWLPGGVPPGGPGYESSTNAPAAQPIGPASSPAPPTAPNEPYLPGGVPPGGPGYGPNPAPTPKPVNPPVGQSGDSTSGPFGPWPQVPAAPPAPEKPTSTPASLLPPFFVPRPTDTPQNGAPPSQPTSPSNDVPAPAGDAPLPPLPAPAASNPNGVTLPDSKPKDSAVPKPPSSETVPPPKPAVEPPPVDPNAGKFEPFNPNAAPPKPEPEVVEAPDETGSNTWGPIDWNPVSPKPKPKPKSTPPPPEVVAPLPSASPNGQASSGLDKPPPAIPSTNEPPKSASDPPAVPAPQTTGTKGEGKGSDAPPTTAEPAPAPPIAPPPVPAPPPQPNPQTPPQSKPNPPAQPNPSKGFAPLYAQCGGRTYKGPTTCAPGSRCNVQNEWYSQCISVSPNGHPGNGRSALGPQETYQFSTTSDPQPSVLKQGGTTEQPKDVYLFDPAPKTVPVSLEESAGTVS
ncbi:hypothetical protein BLS_001808 [Venturia inaequalis]|uniref:CBM1 domain-containing protein n=1 Tax=Venturia inaequalis TaxID=5025 RepID=A0A8H3YYT1_VENIN|nr:hypothetical protein BLS_001808 [Venturia inaequalis]